MQDMTSTRPIDRSPFDRTIAVWNHKGGTFKTSVVANLGYLFAAGGNKVLLVDMDPQANLDIDFGIPANERERGIGLAEALREGTALPPPQHLSENLHLVSGGPALHEFTDPASLAAILERVTTARYDLLAQALAPLAWDYDLIFIDSGPAQTLLSQTILGVARWLVVPTRTDNASITGLVDVQDAIDGVASCNPDLQLLGVVLAGVGARATRIAADKRHAIDTVLGAGTVFDAVIHYSEKVSVLARQQGKTVAELANEYHNTQPAYTYLAKGQNIPNVAKAAVSIETDYLRLATEISDRMFTSDDMRLAEEWANSGRTVGALPRRQRPQRPTPRTTSQPPVSSPDTPAPKKAQKTPTSQPGRQRINVTVYVVPELHERLRSRSAATGVTVSDLVVHALAFVADHAGEAIADDLRVETGPGMGAGLFDVTPSRPVGVAKTQLGVRMTRHNKDGLDQLTRTSGARDRSHLVSVAVRDYLDSNPVKKGRHVR